MTTRPFTVLALVAILFAAAPVPAQQRPPLLIESMTGRDLFQFYCATCHGQDARGAGPVAAVLKIPPADLTTIARRRGGRFPRAEVVGFVADGPATIPAHGSTAMPIWGPIFRALDPSDTRARIRIENLVSYLESIQAK
jgi:mono/diheme cytochrome c family protein